VAGHAREFGARRMRNARAHMVSAIVRARGPDRRTMPMPPAPWAVAIAAMVSLSTLDMRASSQ